MIIKGTINHISLYYELERERLPKLAWLWLKSNKKGFYSFLSDVLHAPVYRGRSKQMPCNKEIVTKTLTYIYPKLCDNCRKLFKDAVIELNMASVEDFATELNLPF